MRWHGEKSNDGQEQMLLKAPAYAPSVGFSVPSLMTVHNLFGKALEKK